MENKYLKDLLNNLQNEGSPINEESIEDVKNYLDSTSDENYNSLKKRKQHGKVYRTTLSYTRGKTGNNSYYEVDFQALKEVLEKITKKTFTLTQVENIVSAVRLALGVSSEEEKDSFISQEEKK